MPTSSNAFARDWLRLAQGIDPDNAMAARTDALIRSSHAAVDRATDKACARQGSEALFDVRMERFASILAGRTP